LDNNREIEFNGGEHRHFDHGYAVTSHSSQGLTAKRVLVNAATVTTSSLFLISGLVTMARERTIAASASRH
jgi:ATP-dependent exoDNAse (exonuclease V) alpha subunit